MEKKRQIADEMIVLLRQLVMQNQLVMAAHVLKAYFLRTWQIDEDLANYYVKAFFKRYYPEQLEKHLKRLNKAS